jgi:hypothetical protein
VSDSSWKWRSVWWFIANLSVDLANGVNSAITLPVIGVLMATVVVTRRSAVPAAIPAAVPAAVAPQ